MGISIPQREISALNSFTIESALSFSSGVAQVRKFNCLHPTTDVWTADGYFLAMMLAPRPGPAQATYLDTSRKISVDLGRILFVPPGRTVKSGSDAKGEHRSMLCQLSTEMVDGLVGRRPTWSDAKLAEGLRLNSPEVEWLLRKIYREVQDGGFAAQIMVESLACALSVALVRQFGLDVETPMNAAGGLSPWRMRLIRDRVKEERAPPNLAELAALCDMSVRHLCRAFKAETGQTVGRFVEQVVMERARALLSRGEIAISEIAGALGYSTVANFSSAFRRATGARPSELIRTRHAPAEQWRGA